MKRSNKKNRKDDFVFATRVYSQAIQNRRPCISARPHPFVEGQIMETQHAFEMALYMIYHAKDSFEEDEQYARDIFSQAKGILLAHGMVLSLEGVPEIPIVPKGKKPS
jgi:hypothetical protein